MVTLPDSGRARERFIVEHEKSTLGSGIPISANLKNLNSIDSKRKNESNYINDNKLGKTEKIKFDPQFESIYSSEMINLFNNVENERVIH